MSKFSVMARMTNYVNVLTYEIRGITERFVPLKKPREMVQEETPVKQAKKNCTPANAVNAVDCTETQWKLLSNLEYRITL